MGFWGLTREQRDAVRRAVEGRLVHDLGAGDCTLAEELVKLGARAVVAVDKEQMPRPSTASVCRVQLPFAEFLDAMEVAVVSWPTNRIDDPDLVALLERCQTVIYLGSNVDLTSCGSRDMFMHFTCRELIEHIPDRKNTLLVMGALAREGDDIPVRLATGEELAGLLQWLGSPPLSYEETLAMSAWYPHVHRKF